MEKITVPALTELKAKKRRITMLTAYDYPTAKLVDEAGVDAVLVGDSVGNVVLGHPSTLPVDMDDMVHHTKAVARGIRKALLISDMPFMSYQASVEEAIRNAGRLVKEGSAEAVKVEGGREILPQVKGIISAGIPVMGHLGLTPQRVYRLGGLKVQGKGEKSAREILDDARKLEKAGVFSLVLECIPWQLSKLITECVHIPTIGIGAGPYCDGQVLVIHDLLGLSGFQPKFVKSYAQLSNPIMRAIREFTREVQDGKFPSLDQSYEMPDKELKQLLRNLRKKR